MSTASNQRNWKTAYRRPKNTAKKTGLLQKTGLNLGKHMTRGFPKEGSDTSPSFLAEIPFHDSLYEIFGLERTRDFQAWNQLETGQVIDEKMTFEFTETLQAPQWIYRVRFENN